MEMISLANQSKYYTIDIIKKIGSSFSIITNLFVLLVYWLVRENRVFTLLNTNIIILSITNSIFSLSMVLPLKSNNSLMCEIQAFSLNTFQQAQFICSCVLGYCCFITVIKKNHLEKHYLSYRILFYSLEFGIPLILSSIILFTHSYGDSGGFCWLDIKNKNKRTFISKLALILFSTLWFLLIVNLFFIIKLIVILRKNKINNPIYKHMILYPVVILISAIPATVNRCYAIFNRQESKYVFALFQMISETFCGLVINVLFLSSPWIRESITNIILSFRYRDNLDDGLFSGIETEHQSESSNIIMDAKRIE